MRIDPEKKKKDPPDSIKTIMADAARAKSINQAANVAND